MKYADGITDAAIHDIVTSALPGGSINEKIVANVASLDVEDKHEGDIKLNVLAVVFEDTEATPPVRHVRLPFAHEATALTLADRCHKVNV